MAIESKGNAEYAFTMTVHGFYAGLVSKTNAELFSAPEPDLGGSLLYVGELDGDGRALVVASNIAGAASLCAAADPVAQKRALRDGVIDFLVNSLDEALRILKNEIRKREAVSVCVALAPETLECEMLERGVLPDLLRPSADSKAHDDAHRRHFASLTETNPMAETALVVWRVDSAPTQWLPRLDAIALDCLEADAGPARRWLRLGPRYLGRMAQGVRLLVSDREFCAKFIGRVRAAVEAGEIAVPVEIRATFKGGIAELHFAPKDATRADQA